MLDPQNPLVYISEPNKHSWPTGFRGLEILNCLVGLRGDLVSWAEKKAVGVLRRSLAHLVTVQVFLGGDLLIREEKNGPWTQGQSATKDGGWLWDSEAATTLNSALLINNQAALVGSNGGYVLLGYTFYAVVRMAVPVLVWSLKSSRLEVNHLLYGCPSKEWSSAALCLSGRQVLDQKSANGSIYWVLAMDFRIHGSYGAESEEKNIPTL